MNVFVLGNGESRLQFSLKKLKRYGKTYGCNAIYRDFSPDVLLSIDRHMVNEIIDAGYHEAHTCYFANDDRANRIPDDCLVGEYGKTQYCGPTAIRLAIKNESPIRVFMIGFDIIDKKWSNVYCGTNGYEDHREEAKKVVASGGVVVHNQLTLTQLLDIFHQYNQVQFIKVMDKNKFQYSLWSNVHNLKYMPAKSFHNKYCK